MRNTYEVYKVCKNIRNNWDVHTCDDKNCNARGEIGTSKAVNAKKASKLLNKNSSDDFLKSSIQQMRYEAYAENEGFVEVYYCDKDTISFTSIKDEGIKLTDNLFLPFTPIGLWKEIYKEHKVFGRLLVTVITSLVLSMSGITLAYSWNLMKSILGV